jgi:hypothetical protein
MCRPAPALRVPQGRVATLLAPVGAAARRAMVEAVAPWLHATPPAAAAAPAAARPVQAPKPALRRQAGQTLHVTVGGHRVALRTSEDGGQLRRSRSISARRVPAYRSLMDAFAQAVSAGLARGVPLADYVEAFAYTRFGPAGVSGRETRKFRAPPRARLGLPPPGAGPPGRDRPAAALGGGKDVRDTGQSSMAMAYSNLGQIQRFYMMAKPRAEVVASPLLPCRTAFRTCRQAARPPARTAPSRSSSPPLFSSFLLFLHSSLHTFLRL